EQQIVLEDDKGGQARVDKEALAELCGILKGNLRLVVLNACSSEPHAEALARHVDCAIGMNKPIGDEAAIAFAASFYQVIGFGQPVETAFRLGKNELSLRRLGEEDTPQLKTREGVDAAAIVLV